MAIKTYNRGSTAKLSENFKVSEFLCHGNGCCKTGKVDEKLVEIVQKIRTHFGKPVHISSAYRCSTWNEAVGGVSGSYHCYGQAADIKVEGIAPAEVAKYAESIGVLGIGLYETDKDGHFVHVDTRTTKSFWYGQGQAKRTTFGGATKKETAKVQKTCKVELPILTKGDSGEYVKAMQLLLIGHGYNVGATGNYGNGTEKVLHAFKKDVGLKVTSDCGAQTWAALLRVD